MKQKSSSVNVSVIVFFIFAISISFLLGMNFGNHPSPFFASSSFSSDDNTGKNKFLVDAQNKNKQNKFSSSSSISSSCPPTEIPKKETKKGKNNQNENTVNNVADDETEQQQLQQNSKGIPPKSIISQCVESKMKAAQEYVKFSDQSAKIREEKGPLMIAAFSRLWVPPIHGTGGMQFHALHLYSQLAVKGHTVHVFVTGPSNPHACRNLMYSVDPETHTATITHEDNKASLFVHQVPSSEDSEYSVEYFENCLKKVAEVNETIVKMNLEKKPRGFDVVHSESWAGVPNIFQIGLPAFVTWHGSMLDWFRNEINFIVHNFRMRGKMTGENTAQRMKDLGSSVAYESYMLLSVPDHIVISDSAASDLKRVNLIDPDAVHVIYNGVNTKSFKPADDRDAMRKSFLSRVAKMSESDISLENLFLVGCGGRLDGIKGHHQLSIAMKTVLNKKKNIALLVAGRGHESHRYEELKTQGLRVFMLGMLNQKDLAEFYQTIDVFVDPFYQHHGLNTVMLEASLSGVPIVVTDLASAATTCPCNGGFGLTFPLGEPEVLVDRLLWLEEHPQERKEMGQNGRKRAQMLFSSSVMASRYEHLMYEAVENPRPLVPITGKITCKHAYPKMCYRAPHDIPESEREQQHLKKKKKKN